MLESWFESEILRATLATDAVIGAMTSPRNAGSGYVGLFIVFSIPSVCVHVDMCYYII